MPIDAATHLDEIRIFAGARSVVGESAVIAAAIEELASELQDRSREWAATRSNLDDVVYMPGFVDVQHSAATTPTGTLVTVIYTAELRPTL